jgi:hypothetical protein
MPEPVNDTSNVVTKQETTEVVLPPGSESTVSSLSSMFDRIQSGKEEGKTADQVISEKPEPEEKKEEKIVKETKPEPKVEESDLSKKLDESQKKKDEDAEISREKLRQATDEKKEEKKAEEKKEEKPEDDVPEDELKVLPADQPKTAKRIQALLKKIDSVNSEVTKTRAEAKEKADKLAELEKKLADVKPVDPATDAKVKEQLDELAMYRRRYALDKDPEIKTKFDARVETAEKTISDTLIARNASEGLLKVIKEEGGWIKFSTSLRQYPINDGEGGVTYITGAEYSDRILQALPLGERKAIEAAMLEQINTNRDKDRYFKEQTETASKYFKEQEEKAAAAAAAQQKQMEEAKKEIETVEKKILEADWLKDREVDPKASAAEKAAAEEYNRYNAQLRSLVKKAFKTNDVPGLMEIITDSVRYYDERRTSSSLRSEVAKLKSELAAKQAEIDRFKGASRSVPKAGSIATNTAEPSRPEAPVGISAAFDALERGERLLVGRRGGSDDE